MTVRQPKHIFCNLLVKSYYFVMNGERMEPRYLLVHHTGICYRSFIKGATHEPMNTFFIWSAFS